jgi:hypothetical protein
MFVYAHVMFCDGVDEAWPFLTVLLWDVVLKFARVLVKINSARIHQWVDGSYHIHT